MLNLSLETSSGPVLLRGLQLLNREEDNNFNNISRNSKADFSERKYKIETSLSKGISKFNFSLASLASVFRFFSGFGLMKELGEKTTKFVLSMACVLNGGLALLGGRSWDGLALLVEPILHSIFGKKEIDIGKNIVLAMSQMITANEGYVPRVLAGQKLSLQNFIADFKNNAAAFKRIISELASSSFGSKRRFLTGFSAPFVSDKLKRAFSAFNIYGAWESFKQIFNRPAGTTMREAYLMFMRRTGLFRLQEIFKGDAQRDKGHTHYLSSLALLGSSLLSTVMGSSQKKLAALVDFAANLFTSASIFGHPDTKRSVAGLSLGFSALSGALRSFFFSKNSLLDAVTGSFGLMGSMVHLNRTIQRTQESDLNYIPSEIPKTLSASVPGGQKIILQEKILREDLRKHPERVYLYADNLMKEGYGSQASEMRGEANAIAMPTMHTPYDDVAAYFSDKDYANNISEIDKAFAQIPSGRTIVIPAIKDKSGNLVISIGSGLAYMREKAYSTYCYLQSKLAELITSVYPESVPTSVAEH